MSAHPAGCRCHDCRALEFVRAPVVGAELGALFDRLEAAFGDAAPGGLIRDPFDRPQRVPVEPNSNFAAACKRLLGARLRQETAVAAMTPASWPCDVQGATVLEKGCAVCGLGVWVSPSSQSLLTNDNAVFLCLDCIGAELKRQGAQ